MKKKKQSWKKQILKKSLTHYKPFKGKINMKKIIMSVTFLNVALMATGCSKPISMCFKYYSDKSARENCINTRINEVLPQGYSYQGHLNLDNIKKDNVSKTPTVSNKDFYVQIQAFKKQSSAQTYVKEINTRISYNAKVLKGKSKKYPYIVVVEGFNSSLKKAEKFRNEMKAGESPDALIKQFNKNSARIKHETKKAQDIENKKMYEEDRKSAELNLNTMCNDLQAVLNKFIKEKKQPKVIAKAQRDLDKCKKNNSELRDLR